jgi:hypothetical protein
MKKDKVKTSFQTANGNSLSETHLEELKASGLSDHTIDKSQIFTCSDNDFLKEHLGYTLKKPCLVIPHFDLWTNKIVSYRFKPDPDSGLSKYLCKKGTDKGFLYSPPWYTESDYTDKILYVVEGQKNCLLLAQMGYAVISLTGCTTWNEKSSQNLRDDWHKFLPIVKGVKLVFDRDIKPQAIKSVSLEEIKLSRALNNFGIKDTAIISLPLLKQSKSSPDEYVKAHSVEALRIILDGRQLLGSVCAADIIETPIEFLWFPYLPLREITLVTGLTGSCKTTYLIYIIALMSRGKQLPGEQDISVKRVLYCVKEDSVDSTTVPRLREAGADLLQVQIYSRADFLSFDEFIQRVENEVTTFGIDLIVIDPLDSFLDFDADTSKPNMRMHLEKLKDLVERLHKTLIFVRHGNKQANQSAIGRVLGSVAFTATCRSLLVFGKHPTKDGYYCMAHAKINIEKKGETRVFTLKDTNTPHIAKVIPVGTTALTADELSNPDSHGQRKENPIEVAIAAIKSILTKHGMAMLSVDLQTAVRDKAECSQSTYQNARKKCNLIRGRNPKEQPNGCWWSKLPGQHFPWDFPT